MGQICNLQYQYYPQKEMNLTSCTINACLFDFERGNNDNVDAYPAYLYFQLII